MTDFLRVDNPALREIWDECQVVASEAATSAMSARNARMAALLPMSLSSLAFRLSAL